MKKLIVSMNVTLDGFLSGPDHDLNWHVDNWTTEMGDRLGIELNRADTILLGRVTYQTMAAYWPIQSANLLCARDDIAMVDMMNTFRKVVYSKTLTQPEWNNTVVISGNIKTNITKLKRSAGKHIMVYGSSQLVAALMQHNLVDEYQLWVHPVMIGKGNPLFTRIKQYTGLRLINTTTFKSGVVLMDYQVI